MKTRNVKGEGSIALAMCIALCSHQLTVGTVVLAGGATEIVGMAGGRVIDRATRMPVVGARFEARLLATGERFEAATDSQGNFLVEALPAGMYAFSVAADNERYDVAEAVDVRLGMPFVLESCYELDRGARELHRSESCRTPFVPEARVVTLGAQRFLLPARLASDMVQAPANLPTIQHEPLECLPNDQFPMVDAEMTPFTDVQVARLYFRAGQHPDLYFVEMTFSEGRFHGVLPKAAGETTYIHYYLEAITPAFDSVRSEEFVADVTTSDECRRRAPVAWFTGTNPGIVVNAVSPGAPAVPAGFQAAGISAFISSAGVVTGVAAAAGGAAGGGLGALGVALVVSGAAAGAGGIIAAATGDDEASEPQP